MADTTHSAGASTTGLGHLRPGETMSKDTKTGHEPGSEEHLPSRQTFLLRFSDATRPEAGIYHGRVEHLGTGKTSRFTTFPEVIEFAGEVMTVETGGADKNS